MVLAVRRTFVTVLGLALLAAPLAGVAGEMEDARVQAEADARADSSGWLWFGAGCLFNLLGIGAAYAVQPGPAATRLLGRSPEYTAAYTDFYRAAMRGHQVNSAIAGCLLSTAAYVAFYVYVYWLVSSIEFEGCYI